MNLRTALSHPVLLAALCGCAADLAAPGHLVTEVQIPPLATASVSPPQVPGPSRGEVVLRSAAGQEVGRAIFTEDAQGRVHVSIHTADLTPGLHGLHLHAVGACDGTTTPAFSSAGGHFNPTGKQHGHHNPAGHHSGDLPNLLANEAGVGRLSIALQQFALAELFDADGTSLVLHQNEDDLRTDTGPLGPGNSGPRIACGVVGRP